MTTYVIGPGAQADMDDIWDYIGIKNGNPDAADKLVATFYQTYEMLGRNPAVGMLRSDLAPNIRLFPVGNYVVIFRPSDVGVYITQVVHGARDLKTAFRDVDD